MLTRRIVQTLKRSGARGFAAPGKGKGGGANAIVEEAVDLAKFVPTNIFKEGSHAELKDPAEYPEWLFKLLDVQPTLGELERAGFDNLELEQQRRMLTLANRRFVKSNNAAKSKK
uniref:Large ribosomal subunit protein mL54 n=1 Tax=Globisporangium ultimum (strain ATCC 200006 / CBS 805.95 / DAOM BR144) TaxID=431595 RepID=K3W4W9_GLOUD